jgi:DNA-binding XRE family transcriptional regulator
MKSPIERIVTFIRARRAELGISQNELARLSGLNPGTLANIMVGRVTKAPSLETLQRLAGGLKVDGDYLFRIARGLDPGKSTALPAAVPAGAELVRTSRPNAGRFPLSDDEWAVIESSRRAGLYVDLERHAYLLDASPAERKWLFAGLTSLAGSIESNQRKLSKNV